MINNVRLALFTILLIVCVNDNIYAQMFSVQSERSVRLDAPTNNVILGFEPTTFSFRGDDNLRDLSFSDPIYRFRAELSGFQGYLGIGYNLGDEDMTNYLNAGAQIEGEYRVAGNRRFFIGTPFVLSTDYLQVGYRGEVDRSGDFQQSSAMVGLGLNLGVRLFEQVRLESRVVPFYGFTVTSFGATGGTRSSLTNQNRIYLDRVLNRIGFTAGFDLGITRYNVDDPRHDYDVNSNSFVIGITF